MISTVSNIRAILKITKGEADGAKQRAAIEGAFRDACGLYPAGHLL